MLERYAMPIADYYARLPPLMLLLARRAADIATMNVVIRS